MTRKNESMIRSEDQTIDLQKTKNQLNFIYSIVNKLNNKCKLTIMSCHLCKINFNNAKEYDNHKNNHKQLLLNTNKNQRNRYYKQHLIVNFKSDKTENKVIFTLKNISDCTLNICHIYLINNFITTFIDATQWPQVLLKDMTTSFNVDRKILTSNTNNSFVISLEKSTEYMELHVLPVNDFLQKQVEVKKVIKTPMENIPKDVKLVLYELKDYDAPKELKQLMLNKFETSNNDYYMKVMKQNIRNLKDKILNTVNYVEIFTLLLNIEDTAAEIEMLQYDQVNKDVKNNNKPGIYEFDIEDAVNAIPCLMNGDRLLLTPMNAYVNQLYAKVTAISSSAISFQMLNKIDKPQTVATLYKIQFLPNRLNYILEHLALEKLNKNTLSNLFPITFGLPRKTITSSVMWWLNKNVEANPEQRQAVTNIYNSTHYPLPYIIFGPPGTGKTKTIVEAICQLSISNNYCTRILVCAPTNAACDEIAERILEYIPSDTNILYRLYSTSFKNDNINRNLEKNSNYVLNYYPKLSLLYNYKILITTLSMAGKLVQARINNNHFTHLFIDECGSATETAALIPIAGICSNLNGINARIIISGDPMQLGPVIQSDLAEELGLRRSLLERLMKSDFYTLLNSLYITKLVRNYRSHPAILTASNKLFYNNELIPCADKAETHWAINWKYLPSSQIPIIFESVIGFTSKEENSTSSFNMKEVHRVMFYLENILRNGINKRIIEQEDIGILSPYKLQCSKISKECRRRNWNDLLIGSVEQLQGKEKPIIIVSTVKARNKSIGFLNNPKRTNVLLTRSKALLIIIGDPNILQNDKSWRTVVELCIENKVLVGSNFELKPIQTMETHSIYNQKKYEDLFKSDFVVKPIESRSIYLEQKHEKLYKSTVDIESMYRRLTKDAYSTYPQHTLPYPYGEKRSSPGLITRVVDWFLNLF